MANPENPYAVTLDADKRAELARMFAEELRLARTARSAYTEDHGYLDFAWALYEQQSQQSISRDAPRFGSADLTSPIGTENVDALAARAVKTIMVEPVWIVEGTRETAKKAPLVEEFMQWRQEQLRLQQTLKRGITSCLVETGGILEVCEDAESIMVEETVRAQPMTDEMGRLVLDGESGKPIPTLDEQGKPVPATDPNNYVEVKREFEDVRRRGAFVRRRSMKDFLFLPGHAEDEREVWGRATRFYVTKEEVDRKVKAGQWDKESVELLGTGNEREQRAEQDRAGVTVEVSHGTKHGEFELWRVQAWLDIGKGLKCYSVVVSETHTAILEIQCDWLNRWRTVVLAPYPCPYSVYPYSMILTKLLTTIEEHTAWRNMNADRGTLKANAPLKLRHGSSWDPELQPFGAGQVIRLADMNEVQPFEFEDVSAQAINKEERCVTDGQRIIGMNDIAIGQVSEKSRTLGENQMATRESFTRTDDPIGNLQEAMEDLGALIHAIEVQALKEQEHGVQAPAGITEAIQKIDPKFDGTFTSGILDGAFRFKPRGSVESADPNRRMKLALDGVNQLFMWAKANPHIAARVASPEFADALMQIYVTEFKPRDRQAFLGPVTPPPPPPGPPGMPPGAPQGALPPGHGPAPDFGGQALIGQMLQGLH